ncbi:hypothetical protein SAMD00019534_049910 [Acytostelium subglobosum LB1]|uniref:hypothetical protein n=1 Tax=Acytostelium subglobosum LB1 TaxID=1410327 RepID=UPI0006447CBC|nr:hypothetical protein SAMD00019534_049910 [Acytostelium subglobosum LB1]GAM21816.1 hypothetical protein SAMD00019534_049910 [Acytostelium subglobosum LB1]|eukprot:XP_012754916.1 hypothetical protein SAMD00019534_049910 [Acytostelium subglobosum LB1]
MATDTVPTTHPASIRCNPSSSSHILDDPPGPPTPLQQQQLQQQQLQLQHQQHCTKYFTYGISTSTSCGGGGGDVWSSINLKDGNNVLDNKDMDMDKDNIIRCDHMSNIPFELMLQILSLLNPLDVICSIGRVSKLLYRCSRNNTLWRELIIKQLNESSSANTASSTSSSSTSSSSSISTSSTNTSTSPSRQHVSLVKSFQQLRVGESSPITLLSQLVPNWQQVNWLQYYAERLMLREPDSMQWVSPLNERIKQNELLNRYRHSSTSLLDHKGKNKFIIIGGNSPEITTVKSDIIIFDPETFTITQPLIKKATTLAEDIQPEVDQPQQQQQTITMGEMDIGLSRHTANYIEDVGIFVFGGSRIQPCKRECSFLSLSSHSVKSNQMDLLVYNPVESDILWKPLLAVKGTPPSPRSDHSSASIGKDIYYFGGSDDSVRPLNDLYVFHTEQLTWEKINTTGDTPAPRSGHSMIAIGKSIYVYGGGVWDKKKCWVNRNSQLFHLDTETWIWSEIKCYRPPSLSTFSSIFAVGHHIFILFGGSSNGLNTNCSYYFDTVANLWHPLKTKNTPSLKNSASLCIIGHRVYFIGGTRKSNYIEVLEMDWVRQLRRSNSFDINMISP